MPELSPESEEDLRRPEVIEGDVQQWARKPRNVRRKRLKTQRQKASSPRGMSEEGILYQQGRILSSTSASDSLSSSSSSFSPGSSSENLPALEGREEEDTEVTCISHGASSVMGRRREMEDTVRVELEFSRGEASSRNFDYFAVFDGHGGAQVAEACRDRMHHILEGEIACEGNGAVDWETVMGRSFEKMDGEVSGREDGGRAEDAVVVEEKTVGSTAVVAVVWREEVVVANCGDSRAVICRNGTALPLTVDHKPDSPDELARIEAAGGKVINWNGNRVLGVLATSRSIGDGYLKPFVIPKPDVTVHNRTKEDEFIILASDGLWDVVSNEVACQVTRRCLEGRLRREGEERGNRALKAASLLVELAIARGSRDNVSVVVVELNKTRRILRSDKM